MTRERAKGACRMILEKYVVPAFSNLSTSLSKKYADIGKSFTRYGIILRISVRGLAKTRLPCPEIVVDQKA